MLRLPGVLATARAACCDARGDRVSTTVSRCWWRAHENCRQRRTPTWIAIRVCTTPNPLMHCARRALHVDAAFNLLAILFCHPNLVCLTLLPIERRVLRHTARYPLCDIAVRGAHSGVERLIDSMESVRCCTHTDTRPYTIHASRWRSIGRQVRSCVPSDEPVTSA